MSDSARGRCSIRIFRPWRKSAFSILAREAFIDWLERKGKELGVKLGRGVSDEIKSTAAAIVEKHGRNRFPKSENSFPYCARGGAERVSCIATEAGLGALTAAANARRQDSCFPTSNFCLFCGNSSPDFKSRSSLQRTGCYQFSI